MAQTDFPRTADAFKSWADRECTAWPESLTAAAYWAWAYLAKLVSNPEYLTDFDAAFADYRAANKG